MYYIAVMNDTLQSKSRRAFELEFILLNVQFDVSFDEDVFDESERNEIIDFVNSLSHEIPVDKTYVDFKGTNFKDTFLTEEGWNALCDTILDSSFCKYIHPRNHETIVDAFVTIARCYIYQCLLSRYGNVEHIIAMVRPNTSFDVVICKDCSNEWKKYPGKWQTWKDEA